MKIKSNPSEVSVSGALSAPSTFRISANRHSFRILSSGLYTNKIRAVIRETACNAYDAHVAAGKAEVPFSLHLPTDFEPFYSITDYGTGLKFVAGGCPKCAGSGTVREGGETGAERDCAECAGSGDYDAVRVLYCNYFSTDKDHSDLFIGAFGLGSKSPFSYTEGFSVLNRYNGQSRVYSCYLDGEGLPTTLLQSVEETPDAENGVEIRFPVKQKDVWEFENQARVALEFFNPAPRLNISVDIKRAKYTLRTERWGIRRDSDGKRETGGGVRAIQGVVAYDTGEIDESRLSVEQQEVMELPLDLFFPIGELEVAASRESLSNSEDTVQNLLAALGRVKEDMLLEIMTEVSECKTAWEARATIVNLAASSGMSSTVYKAFKDGEFDALFPDFKLDSLSVELDQRKYPAVHIYEVRRSWNKAGYSREKLTENLTEHSRMDNPNLTLFSLNPHGAEKLRKTVFVVNDLGNGAERYVNDLVTARYHNVDRVLFLTRQSNKTPVQDAVNQSLELLASIGNPSFRLVTELRDAWKECHLPETPAGSSPVRECFTFDEGAYITDGTLGWMVSWKPVKLAGVEDEVKYYLPLKNMVPESGQFRDAWALRHFVEYVRAAKTLGLSSEDRVYGVPAWKAGKLDASWVNLFDHVMDSMVKMWSPAFQVRMSGYLYEFDQDCSPLLEEVAKARPLSPASPLQALALDWKRVYGNKPVQALRELLRVAQKRGLCAETDTVDLNPRWAEVCKLYPLLNSVVYSSGVEPLIQYIRLMDEDRERNNNEIMPCAPDVAVAEETDYAN